MCGSRGSGSLIFPQGFSSNLKTVPLSAFALLLINTEQQLGFLALGFLVWIDVSYGFLIVERVACCSKYANRYILSTLTPFIRSVSLVSSCLPNPPLNDETHIFTIFLVPLMSEGAFSDASSMI